MHKLPVLCERPHFWDNYWNINNRTACCYTPHSQNSQGRNVTCESLQDTQLMLSKTQPVCMQSRSSVPDLGPLPCSSLDSLGAGEEAGGIPGPLSFQLEGRM